MIVAVLCVLTALGFYILGYTTPRRPLKPRPPLHPPRSTTLTMASDGRVWRWDPEKNKWEIWTRA